MIILTAIIVSVVLLWIIGEEVYNAGYRQGQQDGYREGVKDGSVKNREEQR